MNYKIELAWYVSNSYERDILLDRQIRVFLVPKYVLSEDSRDCYACGLAKVDLYVDSANKVISGDYWIAYDGFIIKNYKVADIKKDIQAKVSKVFKGMRNGTLDLALDVSIDFSKFDEVVKKLMESKESIKNEHKYRRINKLLDQIEAIRKE